MKIGSEKYSVSYDASTGTIVCEGMMDLRGKEGYRDVSELFDKVVEEAPETITLDITNLKFLNSSGITTLGAGLVIRIRNKGASRLVIRCTRAFSWQERSMKGIRKLMPDLTLSFDSEGDAE